MTGSRRLQGRRAIVTGANRGLGLEIARHFAEAGADVALGARDEALLFREIDLLNKQFPERHIIGRGLDVQVPADTVAFTKWAIGQLGHVDVLVNNAGVYGPMGDLEAIDWAKWIDAIHINLMGSVLMARAVLGHMKARRQGSIIQISGGGAANPMPRLTAYAASKAGVARFVESLALEVKEYGIDVNSIAPGALNTRLLDEVLEAGPERVGQAFYDRAVTQKQTGGVALDKGAELAVFLASDASRGITGRLISALWDLYEDWPHHLEALDAGDLYTLRRITGRDRGQTWGDR